MRAVSWGLGGGIGASCWETGRQGNSHFWDIFTHALYLQRGTETPDNFTLPMMRVLYFFFFVSSIDPSGALITISKQPIKREPRRQAH